MATRVYSLTVAYNAGGQFATTTWHYSFDDAGYASTSAAAIALVNAFVSGKTGALRNVLPGAVALLSVKSRCVDAPGGFEAVTLYAGGIVGNRPGAMQVAGTGPCIIWYPINNNFKRGRTFLPGVSILDCGEGVISAALDTAIITFITALLTPMALVGGGAPTATLTLYSPVPKTHQTIQQGQISSVLGTQRRRQIPV
jgi:hypothetical protein